MGSIASILIPTYDRAEMLRTAVESALRQTHRELEVLIGVDGGTPDVIRTAQSFTDPRVRVLVWTRNRGPYPVYEDLVKESKGDYILMFSDDDKLEPAFFTRCIGALEHSNRGFAWTDDIPWNGTKIIPDPNLGRKMPFLYPSINSTVFRRETLEHLIDAHGGLFRRDLHAYGDCVLFYRLSRLLGPDGAAHVAERLVWIRIHERQLSRNPRLWSLVEDVIVSREIGRPVGFRHEFLILLWLLKKKAEHLTGKRLPQVIG